MNLTEKEINYIRDILLADENIDLELVLNVINKKRSSDDAVGLDDFLEIINRLDSSTPDNGDGPQKQAVSEGKAIGKNLKKAQQLMDARDLEALAEKSTYIAAHILENLEQALKYYTIPAKPKRYIILSGKTQAYLSSEVAKYMKQGWQPYGGVSAAAFGVSPVAGNQYIQAMVQY